MKLSPVQLYPKQWRERYGAEMEALIEDMPSGRRGTWNLLKGAMEMRLRYQSGKKLTVGLVVFGALAGWAVSYLATPLWEAKAVLQIKPAVITDMKPTILHLSGQVTSRTSLAGIMSDPAVDLFSDERRHEPLEQIVDTMRHDIRITINPKANPENGAQVFMVRFQYPDANKAAAALRALVSRLAATTSAEYVIDTLDPETVSQTAIFPKREAFAITGAAAGLLLALILLLIRRAASPRRPETA